MDIHPLLIFSKNKIISKNLFCVVTTKPIIRLKMLIYIVIIMYELIYKLSGTFIYQSSYSVKHHENLSQPSIMGKSYGYPSINRSNLIQERDYLKSFSQSEYILVKNMAKRDSILKPNRKRNRSNKIKEKSAKNNKK